MSDTTAAPGSTVANRGDGSPVSGEWRLARGALAAGAAAAPVFAAIAFVVRGADAAVSVAVALAIVLANTLVSALLLAWATRRWPMFGAAISMPSYAVRMGVILFLLSRLREASFVDPPVFAIAFGVGVVATLALEARTYRRTPWAALTLAGDRSTDQRS